MRNANALRFPTLFHGGLRRVIPFWPAVVAATLAAGCFSRPDLDPDSDPSRPTSEHRLVERVQVALAGHEQEALTYGGLYAVLADRFAEQRDATTTEAAAVAGRAADILGVPGLLREIVNDELNPLIGKPQPITPELAAQAAARLRALSSACREVAR